MREIKKDSHRLVLQKTSQRKFDWQTVLLAENPLDKIASKQ
jgi:hypothetical protein